MIIYTFLFIPYLLPNTNSQQITKFPTALRQNDFSVTNLKDTNYINAHPDDEKKKLDEVDWEKECKKFSKKEMEEIAQTYKSEPGRIKTVSANGLPVRQEDLQKIQCLERQLKTTNKEAYLTTTFDLNDAVNTSQTKAQRNQKRRGNEYQFDTVEYYDDVIDFDDGECPDSVDVVTLQVLDITPYDIECELLTEWTSLE